MEKVLTNSAVEEILNFRLPITSEFQNCSFILPSGKYLKMYEHHEAYQFLVAEGFVLCIPDAEQLLSDLGYVRYSWVGYLTLPDKELTKEQYKSLEYVLINISKFRDKISIQVQSEPKFYINYPLDDINHILDKIKEFYAFGNDTSRLTIF